MERIKNSEPPAIFLNERKKEIRLIINDFDVMEAGDIRADKLTIASYRTAFYRYLMQYNKAQVSEKHFSIRYDEEKLKFIICRER